MKVQLWMRHTDAQGRIRAYRTITSTEAAEILRYILQNDGTRPWEREQQEEVAA